MRVMICWVGFICALTGCQTEIAEEPMPASNCLDRIPEYNLITERAKAKAAGEAAARYRSEKGFSESSDEVQPASHTNPILISTPAVSFPVCASTMGIEGSCEVYHDVTKDGEAENIIAICSSAAFVREAEKTVARLTYRPASINGEAVDYKGVILPLKFMLEDYEATEL